MNIKESEFAGSFTDYRKCPAPVLPEYAFIGRSNVGKSSLINMICQRQALAHVSREPGKTRSMNYFNINKAWYLVDLPGYGYAKLPKTLRIQWETMTREYMSYRANLQCAFLLIDSCVPPQAIDLEFANSLGEWQVPFVLVFTKSDRKKAEKNQRAGFLREFEQAFLETWEAMPPYFITSAETGAGRDEILDFIQDTNLNFTKPTI